MAIDTRDDFLIQLLQKLGAPLMQAVGRHSTGNSAGDATVIASLLSESVKISVSLSQAMNLKEQDGNSDAIRASLAALAGGLVADFYAHTGRIPQDNDSNKISKSLESVIVFADNFVPAAEHAKRLKTLDGTPPFFDPVQTNMYAMHALLPVISAISEFSFGQPETKLLQDVANQLRGQAKDLLGKVSASQNEMDELVALQALAQIYAGAHRMEIAKLKKSEQQEGADSIKSIWSEFAKQMAMVEILMGGMTGTSDTGSRSSGGGVKPAMDAPDQDASTSAPAQPAPPPSTQGASPMAFFKKK